MTTILHELNHPRELPGEWVTPLEIELHRCSMDVSVKGTNGQLAFVLEIWNGKLVLHVWSGTKSEEEPSATIELTDNLPAYIERLKDAQRE